VDLVLKLDALGYRGDYSFEVFNDDYLQLPLPVVAHDVARALTLQRYAVVKKSLQVG
jgi:hypothetical protein